ncbi:hypothetical protein ACE14D_19430 [Streptomyces sp. Act-28]
MTIDALVVLSSNVVDGGRCVDQRGAGILAVSGDPQLARVVAVVHQRFLVSSPPGTSRITLRTGAMIWVTVSWVAAASSNTVQSGDRHCLPLAHPPRSRPL